MKTIALGGTLAIALCCANPAQAQDTSRRDLRCLAVTAATAATVGDPEVAKLAAAGSLYFLGRLEGRNPGVDWPSSAFQEFAAMSDEEATETVARCGEVMEEKAAELNTKGEELMREAAPEKSPGS